MQKDVTNVMEQTIKNQLMLVEDDIKNCPDSLWDKKCGGDPYWQQFYHALSGTYFMLNFPDDPQPKFPLSCGGELNGTVVSEPHGKEILLKFLKDTRVHLAGYFKRLDDSMLFTEKDFYGNNLPLLAILVIVSSHIMYHVGVCDAALRESGAKASL